ncbi:MAG: hypothetical protein NTX50_28260, partial [Candidatus Sumerlaeota bacterium]|nr:hypothetical protein [Candidatus Sumerlaeota bacterium]
MKMKRIGRRWFVMRAAAVFALGIHAAMTAAPAYSQPATSSTQDAAAKEKARLPDLDLSIWRSDLNKAARQAVYANKPMLLFFYRPGVSYSLNFAKAMKASPAVSKALLGWVCVSINEWDLRNQEINVKYHIELTPQVVMVSFDGVELGRQEDPINLDRLAKQLEQFGKPNITVTPDSPEVEQGKMPPSLRLVVADAANVNHKTASIAPIGGKKILEFVIGDPESEKKAGVELAGWGKVETKGGEPCRNTDQTGVG